VRARGWLRHCTPAARHGGGQQRAPRPPGESCGVCVQAGRRGWSCWAADHPATRPAQHVGRLAGRRRVTARRPCVECVSVESVWVCEGPATPSAPGRSRCEGGPCGRPALLTPAATASLKQLLQPTTPRGCVGARGIAPPHWCAPVKAAAKPPITLSPAFATPTPASARPQPGSAHNSGLGTCIAITSTGRCAVRCHTRSWRSCHPDSCARPDAARRLPSDRPSVQPQAAGGWHATGGEVRQWGTVWQQQPSQAGSARDTPRGIAGVLARLRVCGRSGRNS
jgi:hypothetical protein